MTGESKHVNKFIEPITKSSGLTNIDKTNYLFAGSLVRNGTCIAITVDIGMTTEIGII